MANYIIHACPQRMWYVEEYLIPSMKNQGIENKNITVECDTEHVGNLEKCMQIFRNMNGYGSAWHMQDDVIICRDFRERTEKYNQSIIVCGFAYNKDENFQYVNQVDPAKMWWSFPCIHIPNQLARDCANWYYGKANKDLKYKHWQKAGKYDDAFFKEFVVSLRPSTTVINLKPNLVDHIDYLIGGTTINEQRSERQVRSGYFDDKDLIYELRGKIWLRNNKNETN